MDIIGNTIPLKPYISLQGGRDSFSHMDSQWKSKADGASRGGSLLAEMPWIYRNKTENERQENILF